MRYLEIILNFCGKTSPTTSDKIVQTLGSKSQFWACGKHFYLFPCLTTMLTAQITAPTQQWTGGRRYQRSNALFCKSVSTQLLSPIQCSFSCAVLHVTSVINSPVHAVVLLRISTSHKIWQPHWLHAGLGQYFEPYWSTNKKLYWWIMKFSWCATTNCRGHSRRIQIFVFQAQPLQARNKERREKMICYYPANKVSNSCIYNYEMLQYYLQIFAATVWQLLVTIGK